MPVYNKDGKTLTKEFIYSVLEQNGGWIGSKRGNILTTSALAYPEYFRIWRNPYHRFPGHQGLVMIIFTGRKNGNRRK
jgi:hypothetical protein